MADRLKAASRRAHSLTAQQIFVGNGSDEVLAHVFMALLKHERPILFPDITYSFYPVYCGLYDVDYRTVPLTDDFSIARRITRSPTAASSSPTRTRRPAACWRSMPSSRCSRPTRIRSSSSMKPMSISAAISAISLVDRHDNLLVVHTLSKSRALAGLRVGFAVGHPALIKALERVKNSFNSYPLDRLAIVGAVAAMEDDRTFRAHPAGGDRHAAMR